MSVSQPGIANTRAARSRVAVYPGTSTRSPTATSTWSTVPRRLFERLIVGVAESPGKSPALPLALRVQLARDALSQYPNVEVRGFNSLLAHFVARARRRRAAARAARGLGFRVRVPAGEHEPAPDPGVETLFLTPAEQYGFISSSLVREISRLGGDVSGFVPPAVAAALQAEWQRTVA